MCLRRNKLSKYFCCWCNSWEQTSVPRPNEANCEAYAFELGTPKSRGRSLGWSPQLRHAPTSTDHLDGKPTPRGSWLPLRPFSSSWARAWWWFLLETGRRVRTVITWLKSTPQEQQRSWNFTLQIGVNVQLPIQTPKYNFVVCQQNLSHPHAFSSIMAVNISATC